MAQAGDGQPVLTVRGLEVRYAEVVAASEVSLEVRYGEMVALLGPNGAGKTSVLRSIMGLVRAARGEVELHDGGRSYRIERKPAHQLARLGIANVPSQHVVLPRMTVAENLEVGAPVSRVGQGRDSNDARRRCSRGFPLWASAGSRSRAP